MLRLFDQLVLVVVAAGIIYFRPEIRTRGETHILDATFRLQDTLGMLALAAGWIIIFDFLIRYKGDRLVALHTQLKSVVKVTALASLWLLILGTVFHVLSLNVLNILIFFGIVTAVCVASRIFLHLLLLAARQSGYNFRFLLVVGAGNRARQMAAMIEEKPELGYKIVGFLAENPELVEKWEQQGYDNWKILGQLDDLQSVLTEERVDEIIACIPLGSRFGEVTTIVRHARDLGIVVRLMPDLAEATLLKHLHVEEFEGECVVTLFREQMLIQLLVKRMMDAALSLAVLIVLLPLMAVVAALIKLTSPGPVFFSQNRVGMNQRQFKLYKFRSMVTEAESLKSALTHLNERDGPVFKIHNDPRVTRLGRFLRKTSIDELPQLLNVLSGEMSLVGPRPPLPEEVKRYQWLFRKRLSVKPGITCIWQVSGRNNVSFDRWMEMDHEYIDNWSLLLDFKILLVTIPAVLFSRGAS
jgi:exopolysaccharide biosynthesis polyprenyl glycosylphosphotransferase